MLAEFARSLFVLTNSKILSRRRANFWLNQKSLLLLSPVCAQRVSHRAACPLTNHHECSLIVVACVLSGCASQCERSKWLRQRWCVAAEHIIINVIAACLSRFERLYADYTATSRCSASYGCARYAGAYRLAVAPPMHILLGPLLPPPFSAHQVASASLVLLVPCHRRCIRCAGGLSFAPPLLSAGAACGVPPSPNRTVRNPSVTPHGLPPRISI